MSLDSLVGKKAAIISSAHSSRYGYVGSFVIIGTVISIDDNIHVLIEEGQSKGKIRKVPVGKSSVECFNSEIHVLKGDGIWENDPEPILTNPDIVINWEQWQPET